MYSQGQEETAILEACKNIRNGAAPGRLLDIGAWNAKTFSNSRALIELGWGALLIEPSPGPMLGLLEEYGNAQPELPVTLMQAAVGIEPGFVEMHITEDAVSTSNAAVFEQWKGTAKYRGNLLIPVITLEQIMNQFGGFDFWSIDAEGLSGDLFQRMLALGYYPHCVCVELDGRMSELCSAATRHGYKVTFSNETNMVVVR